MCFCHTCPPTKLLRRYACKVVELVTYYFVWYKYKARLRIRSSTPTKARTPPFALQQRLQSSLYVRHHPTTSVVILTFVFLFFFCFCFVFCFIFFSFLLFYIINLFFFFHWWLILIIFIHYCCLITRYGLSCTFLQRQAGREWIPSKRWV